MTGARSTRRRWLLTLAGLLAVVALGAAFGERLLDGYVALVVALQEPVRRAGALGALLFTLLAALSVLLGPFSSAPLVPPGVLAWGEHRTFALLLAGWLTGNVLAYLVGRWGARPLVARLVGAERVQAWARELSHRDALVVAVVARLTLPSEVGYVYGLLHFDFRWYLLLTLLAELPTAWLLVYGSEELLTGHLRMLVVLVSGSLLVLALGWWWRKRRRRLQAFD